MKPRTWVISGVLLAVVVVVVALLAWPRGADPLSEEDALATFRDQGNSGSGPEKAETDPAAATPEPGVYRYAGSGSETVQLGPIPAETRQFPTDIHGAVTNAPEVGGESCFVATINLIEQHTEDSTYCRTPEGGLRLEHYEKHQQVSAFDPTVDIRCDPGVLWEPGTAELPLECSLTLLGGPKEVTVELSGTARSSEGSTVELDGAEREVVLVEMHFDMQGSVSGTWDESLRFSSEDGLLVGVDRLFDLQGFASFLEDFSYELTSGVPTR